MSAAPAEAPKSQDRVAAGPDTATTAPSNNQLLQAIDRVDDRGVDPSLRIASPGLLNHREVIEQLPGHFTPSGEVTAPQATERMELRGLPLTVTDFIESLTVVGGHHSLLAVARAGTRYVAGALILAVLRQLHRKAGHRRAAVAAPRPSAAQIGSAR